VRKKYKKTDSSTTKVNFQGKYFLNGAVGEENMRYIGGGSDCCRHKFDSRGDFSRGNEHL